MSPKPVLGTLCEWKEITIIAEVANRRMWSGRRPRRGNSQSDWIRCVSSYATLLGWSNPWSLISTKRRDNRIKTVRWISESETGHFSRLALSLTLNWKLLLYTVIKRKYWDWTYSTTWKSKCFGYESEHFVCLADVKKTQAALCSLENVLYLRLCESTGFCALCRQSPRFKCLLFGFTVTPLRRKPALCGPKGHFRS